MIDSPVHRRILDSAVDIASATPDDDNVVFQHTVFCQTGLPYRRTQERVWERANGSVTLLVEAGRAMDPSSGRFIELPLPFGPKPRLIMAYLNTHALRSGPEVDVGGSMTSFVKRLGFHAHGRDIRTFKEQMSALAASTIRLGVMSEHDQSATTVKADIIKSFNVWFPKDDRQRILWPSTVVLSREYYESLLRHAVPLDERALAALAHSPMALDAYTWMAQRLHRVGTRGQVISWAALRGQFGCGYKQVRQFKSAFKKVLREVLVLYPDARIEETSRGLRLLSSPPPIARRLHALGAVPEKREVPIGNSPISQAAVDSVRANHPGWDVNFLLEKWQTWNKDTKLRNADGAFVAWAKTFTKNKPPR